MCVNVQCYKPTYKIYIRTKYLHLNNMVWQKGVQRRHEDQHLVLTCDLHLGPGEGPDGESPQTESEANPGATALCLVPIANKSNTHIRLGVLG